MGRKETEARKISPYNKEHEWYVAAIHKAKVISMIELKPVQYGAWTIRIRKIPSDYQYFYEYKIELGGEDISKGWVSVPYGSRKDQTIEYAKGAIDTFYKKNVLISEHGAVLRLKYDQFRGSHFG